MKCPNCGAQMKDGHLYCEHCGEEIRIVPEFEPEIENSIRKTLSDVATEIMAPVKEGRASGTEKKKKASGTEKKKASRASAVKRKKQTVLHLVFVLLAVIVFLFVIKGIQYFRPDSQYKKALNALKEKRYEDAAGYFERALELSPTNVSYLNGLSSCYYEMGDLQEAERICLETIALEGSNTESYGRLVTIYERQELYEEINELMQNCKDREICNQYLDYMANAPEADAKGGTYQEIISVKLIGNAAGTIYYTLDGSQPDKKSEVYTTPILLEGGPHTIKAFFVNQYGVESPVMTQQYYIDVTLPQAPGVLPDSGTYGSPSLIEVEIPQDCKVYYTTDRSEPDSGSTLYEDPVWMPVGHSLFRFVAISPGGVCSDITERQYTLDLHPVLSMEAASNQLLLMLKNAGILLNLQGDVPEKKGRNLYTYKYTLTINDHNYYLYREYYEESAGTSNATGNDYVVNYMSGECYRAMQQEDKTFKLYTIEPLGTDTEENES